MRSFRSEGELVDVVPLERGHIHDTFVSRWESGGTTRRLLHQRMNDEVFPDLDGLMRNVRLVTEHLGKRLSGGSGDGFEPMRLVHATDGSPYVRTASGAWRTFVFIENTSSFDRCEGPEQAYLAARAFGWFQRQLSDLDANELVETIPNFFSTPFRLEQFDRALRDVDEARRSTAAEEIAFVQERRAFAGAMQERLDRGAFPERVVHGDTKLNNILFDDDTRRPKGIVDLDTCMPAYSLYDFGDLVRFTAATSAEDERDPSRIGTDLELYRALRDGYLEEAKAFLGPEEISLMPLSARLVTFTIGLRFLTDHLSGDVYFKIDRAGHNLDRARVQLGMVRFMEAHETEMATG